MKRRSFITLLGGAAAAWPLAARAQQSGGMQEIGFLSNGSPRDMPLVTDAFREGLKESGYVEGQNVAFEHRWVEGRYDRLPRLADDLVRRRVAVIVASFYREALAAKSATTTIPIVFIVGTDPVNLVANPDRPEGNVTGVSQFNPSLERNRFELLRELMPKAGPAGVIIDSTRGRPALQTKVIAAAARVVNRPIQTIHVSTENQIAGAFATLSHKGATVILCAGGPLFVRQRDQIEALVTRYSIPVIYDVSEFSVGGLMSYGPSMTDTYRQAGTCVGKILNGTKISELPVIQMKPKLVINLKTAKALGLEVPPTLLARADEVIE
jgi:putative ABC transport system substrate-binding protein